MALTRMRWTDTGADIIGAQPRPGATLRAIGEPRQKRTDIHIHLPRQRTVDASAGASGELANGVTPGRPMVGRACGANPEGSGEFDQPVTLSGTDKDGRQWGAKVYGPAATSTNWGDRRLNNLVRTGDNSDVAALAAWQQLLNKHYQR